MSTVLYSILCFLGILCLVLVGITWLAKMRTPYIANKAFERKRSYCIMKMAAAGAYIVTILHIADGPVSICTKLAIAGFTLIIADAAWNFIQLSNNDAEQL